MGCSAFYNIYRGHTRHLTRVKPGLARFNPGSFTRDVLTPDYKKITRVNSPLVRRCVKFLTLIILLLTQVKCLVWPLYRVRPGLNLTRIILSSSESYSGSDSRHNNPVHVLRHTTTLLYAPILIHCTHEQIAQHVRKGAGSWTYRQDN